jgi:SAM-dependent methyltransferase
MPHLHFVDRYFNLIYCGSVFTHIDDLAEAWLLELRRILSPHGRAYLTIHDNHTIELFDRPDQDHSLGKRMKDNDLYNKSKNSLGMLAIGRDFQSLIFYDIDYFCKTLSSMYEILSVTPEGHGYQTGIVVRRKGSVQ